MSKRLIAATLFAIVPSSAIMAQETRVTTTVTTPAPAVSPPVVNPEAAGAAANAAPAPEAQSSLGADGVIRQMGPQQVVAQAVPPAAANYPPCTKGRTDSCYNPDPGKEADVRRDGKIGG